MKIDQGKQKSETYIVKQFQLLYIKVTNKFPFITFSYSALVYS